MVEIGMIAVVSILLIRKFNQISLLHIEWGLIRLEFDQHWKTKHRIKSAKKQKKIGRGGSDILPQRQHARTLVLTPRKNKTHKKLI